MTKPLQRTLRAAITADGKLDSGEDPALLHRCFEEDLIGEIHLLVRPKIDGRQNAPTLGGASSEYFPASVHCHLLKMEVLGDECLLHYRVLRRRGGSLK